MVKPPFQDNNDNDMIKVRALQGRTRVICPFVGSDIIFNSINLIWALFSIGLNSKVLWLTDRQMGSWPVGFMIIMILVASTHQLKFGWTELSWSVGAECGINHIKRLAQ